jgi:hypothetical protein
VIAQVWANARGWSSFLILSAEQNRGCADSRQAADIAIIARRARSFEARGAADADKYDR